MTISPAKVWSSINNDVDFCKQPESDRRMARPFVEVMPEVLEKHLTRKATVKNILRAKTVFLKYLLENGFIKAWVDSLPEKAPVFELGDRDKISELFDSKLSEAFDMIECASKVSYKEADQEVLIGHLGLTGEALARYKSGTLTIGELLLYQPWIIFSYSK